MNRTIKPSTYRAIYRLLDKVSPVDYDCGNLCNAACCAKDSGDDMGIFLMPGEESVHSKNDWKNWTEENPEECGFPESWDAPVCFVKCKTPPFCDRNKRPIQCRSYPLVPHLKPDGELIMVYNDYDLPYTCPLIEDEIPLNDDFVQATATVWKHLIRDQRIFDLVLEDSIARESDENK